jgi:hypothetical protein
VQNSEGCAASTRTLQVGEESRELGVLRALLALVEGAEEAGVPNAPVAKLELALELGGSFAVVAFASLAEEFECESSMSSGVSSARAIAFLPPTVCRYRCL